ncbi:MAG: L-fucose:H+ symporter permease [Terracidiphilus sp.]|nr:L-fucose:H+ symporter permease [Terracidiphilus sp.]MDR3776601.1 L-fucose:H+ symporter permease [Terracidiphilus sp.]
MIPVASASDAGTTRHAKLVPAGRLLPFLLVTALFFLWGIPNNLNDILIRQFMKSFEINRLQAGLVQSAFYLGYFLLAMPAGQIMRRAGYKTGILIGLCLYGAGCILFWPAAIIGQYWFFLMALFVIATGLAFLETAASPFIVQVGAAETAEQRLNLSQAFNPVGSISAVLIGARFIFSGVELNKTQVAAMQVAGTYQNYLRSETLRVVTPYIVLGAVVLFWAILIARTPFPHVGLDYTPGAEAVDHGPSLFKRKHFVFAVIAQFLYVGGQVGTWSYLIPYAQTYAKVTERSAGYWLTAALVAFAVGRFISTWILRYVPATRLLGSFAVINAAVCATAVLRPGWLGVGCLVAVSFFMSMMFPTIFALGIKGLGPRTKSGGAVIVMAIIGGATLTPVMGKIADVAGVCYGYLVPVACFVGVALYAWLGAQPEPEEAVELALEPVDELAH